MKILLLEMDGGADLLFGKGDTFRCNYPFILRIVLPMDHGDDPACESGNRMIHTQNVGIFLFPVRRQCAGDVAVVDRLI